MAEELKKAAYAEHGGHSVHHSANSPHMKQSKKKTIALVSILCVLIVLGIFISVHLLGKTENNALPKTVVTSTKFSLYHPLQLPAEFTYDPAATVNEKNIVYTTFSTPEHKIVMAQQNAPKQPIQYIDAEETYTISIGKVFILKSEPGKIKSMIDTGTSLILINADDSVSLETMKEFISYLQLQKT